MDYLSYLLQRLASIFFVYAVLSAPDCSAVDVQYFAYLKHCKPCHKGRKRFVFRSGQFHLRYKPVNGGTYTSADNGVIMTNGTVKPDNDCGHNTIVVNGGTFNGGIKSEGFIACGIYVANSDAVTVNGGTFKGNSPANGDDSGKVATFVADGYKTVKNADGSVKVVKA